jgi:hypothetical protein
VPGERRTEEEIRREIAAERDQLATLADLRERIDDKRRPAVAAVGALAAGIAAMAAVKVVRRLRGE